MITDFILQTLFRWQVHEMEISQHLAERKLREHKGDIVEALVELTNWWIYFIVLKVKVKVNVFIYYSINESTNVNA